MVKFEYDFAYIFILVAHMQKFRRNRVQSGDINDTFWHMNIISGHVYLLHVQCL